MFGAEFSSFPLVLIIGQSKKSGNWRKFHTSANQIPESAETLIFSREIPALRARSPPETCLALSFQVFPLVLIIGQPKNPKNSKKANQGELVWGELNQSRQNELTRTLTLRVQNLERTTPHAPKSFLSWKPTIFVLNYCKKPIPNAF
jgi:hypothetical protein